MTPITFPQANVVYAKDQPEYLPLPACRTPEGIMVSCWKLTWRERLRVLWTGRVFVSVMTFNQPLQPLLPTTRLDEVLQVP